MAYLTFFLAIAGFAQVSNFSEITTAEKQQSDFQKGDEEKCGSALGVYEVQADGIKSKFLFKRPHRSQIPFMDPKKNTAIFEIFEIFEPTSKKRSGLLVHRDARWFIVFLKPDIDFPYPSINQTTAIYAAFTEFYEKRNLSPNGVEIEEVTFSSNMLRGNSKSGNIRLKFDDIATVEDFLKETSSISDFFQRLSIPEIRIPTQMYAVTSDIRFKKAKKNRRFSEMYDLIFEKALEVSNGDAEKALFISLISVDLRDRGPCGAIGGRRGHTIVPQSIFDGEVTKSSVIGSRFDAAQHFFGYALLAKKFGKKATSTYSLTTEFQGWRHIGRIFRHLHMGGEPDFDIIDNKKTLGPVHPTYWFQGNDLRLKPKYDTLADKLYNRMGIEFGSSLSQRPSILPSAVINDSKFDQYEAQIGLPKSRDNGWTHQPAEVQITGQLSVHSINDQYIRFNLNLPQSLRKHAHAFSRRDVKLIPVYKNQLLVDCVRSQDLEPNGLSSVHYNSLAVCKRAFADKEKLKFILNYRGRKYQINFE